jgi:HD-like signal output (HDOD) protein
MSPENLSDKPVTKRRPLQERVVSVIKKDSSIPVFSSTALKLLDVTNQEDLDLATVAEIVKLDPGLTSKYLRLANSVAFGGQSITSVQDALVRIGMREIRNLASAIGGMEVLKLFRGKDKNVSPKSKSPKGAKSSSDVEWEMFWLHSLLTARLTDAISSGYRATSGKEYLAGLMHDVGKLFLQRYFPQEFGLIVDGASKRLCGMIEVERELFDITHSEISAMLCEKWHLHPEIIRGIRFHHEPMEAPRKNESDDDSQFLGICLCIADSLSNMCKANIPGSKDLENIDCETLPEWKFLSDFPVRHQFEIDVIGELAKAQEAIEVLSVE